MRETVEYAVGIFHGSIMAIQSGEREGEVKLVVSTSKRTRQDAVYPEESPGERWRPLECALHPSRWDPAPVFSFRFRATERKKVRDGVLAGRNKRDWRVCRTTSVAHFGRENKVKGGEKGLLRNL